MIDLLISIDRACFLFINSTLANPVFTIFFKFITERNNGIIPLLILIPLIIIKEKKRSMLILSLAVVTVAITDPLCSQILKPLFHRLRPCHPSYFVNGTHTFLAGGNFLLGHKTSLSFPSAHAMNIFAQAMLFSMLYSKLRIYFFLFAGLVALSRVYVGVHYPLDILCGSFLGIAFGAGIYYLYKSIHQKITHKKNKLKNLT